MKIEKITTYKTDNKEFKTIEEAENYLLDKVQAELNEKLKPVFSVYYTSAMLNYQLILELVGTPEKLKETLSILNNFSEFPREEKEEDN